jgi:hypothetical protein
MKRTLLAIVLALAVVPVFAGPAVACSCIPGGPKSLAERADVLFAGTAANVSGGGTTRTVAFDVETSFKGAVEEEVVITTPVSSASCGLPFHEGRRYTVFAYTEGTKLMTSSCSGTKLGSIDAARYGVSEGREIGGTPTSADEQEAAAPGQTWPIVAVVGLVLAGGGALLTRRRFARSPSL